MAFEDDRTGTWYAYNKVASSRAKSGGSSRFTDYLAVHFPEVAATIDSSDVGTHLEVSAFKLATQDAIKKNDWPTVSRHFSFIDNVLESAEAELHDAIGNSYLVNLFYNETSHDYAKARTLMPKRLAAALEIMERHYEDMA
jgi:hypothetical protein